MVGTLRVSIYSSILGFPSVDEEQPPMRGSIPPGNTRCNLVTAAS